MISFYFPKNYPLAQFSKIGLISNKNPENQKILTWYISLWNNVVKVTIFSASLSLNIVFQFSVGYVLHFFLLIEGIYFFFEIRKFFLFPCVHWNLSNYILAMLYVLIDFQILFCNLVIKMSSDFERKKTRYFLSNTNGCMPWWPSWSKSTKRGENREEPMETRERTRARQETTTSWEKGERTRWKPSVEVHWLKRMIA